MDLLRIKLQEELEGPHQERIKMMEGEIEKVDLYIFRLY